MVPVDADGMRSFRAGVENVEFSDPSEMSGTVIEDCAEVSARALRAADIASTADERSRLSRLLRSQDSYSGSGWRFGWVLGVVPVPSRLNITCANLAASAVLRLAVLSLECASILRRTTVVPLFRTNH